MEARLEDGLVDKERDTAPRSTRFLELVVQKPISLVQASLSLVYITQRRASSLPLS